MFSFCFLLPFYLFLTGLSTQTPIPSKVHDHQSPFLLSSLQPQQAPKTLIKRSLPEKMITPKNTKAFYSNTKLPKRPCQNDAQCASTAGAACYQGACRCKFGHIFGGLNGSHCKPMPCEDDDDCHKIVPEDTGSYMGGIFGSKDPNGKTSCDPEKWECVCSTGYSYWTNSFTCDVDVGTVVLWIALAIGVVIVISAVLLFLLLCICYSFKKAAEGVGRRLSCRSSKKEVGGKKEVASGGKEGGKKGGPSQGGGKKGCPQKASIGVHAAVAAGGVKSKSSQTRKLLSSAGPKTTKNR